MSRTYWIAKALRSFGFAGLIAFGLVAVITFLNSNAEPSPRATEDGCWGLISPCNRFTLTVFFFYPFGVSMAAVVINLLNCLDCLGLAWAAGKPPRPSMLGESCPARSLFSDFIRENRSFPPVAWRDWGFLSNFGAIVFGLATFLIGYEGARDVSTWDSYGLCDGDYLIPNPYTLNLDQLLILGLFLSFLGISIFLVGQARIFNEIARLAEPTLKPATATGPAPRA